MKIQLVYPTWRKLEHQIEFHLPPHGPVVFAATLPPEVEIEFRDENLQPVDFDAGCDLAAISCMLTAQLPRAFEIAAEYKKRGIPVIAGGIAVQLHAQEFATHVDSVFLGEAEGRMEAVVADFKAGKLQPVYDYMQNPADTALIGPARRDILDKSLYTYRGVQMVDLVHASRGCQFRCFPCCVGFLGGNTHRPRPIDQFLAEVEAIQNNRLFVVDNSLSQNPDWLKELFTAMKPLKRKWVSHPVLYDDKILKLAVEAGCWYVYQAVFDTSDFIRERIKMLKAHGIGIEGTIILGMDEHDEDTIKRLVDFLLEVELDTAEFTILTPFPHSPIRAELEAQGRLLSNHWADYTCDRVLFQPKNLTPEKLRELYHYAWDTFYADGGHALKMGELFRKVVAREMEDGTYRRFNPRVRAAFGRQAA